MKDEIITKLRSVEERLRRLRSELRKLKVKAVSQKTLRDEAETLADIWVEELRSPLEHRFKLDSATISKYADEFKKLHILSRPNNLVKSYLECLNRVLKDFKDALILPIQQISEPGTGNSKLRDIVAKIPETDVSDYLTEAVACADNGYVRAGIVMGWCAAIDHIQKKLVMLGLATFNAASTKLKQQTKGRFKRFDKEFRITTLNELQEVFDTDLLWVLEGMELIDSNQGDRLRVCFQYRNHSAHPGDAPIGEVHLASFFSDIVDIVLTNPKLSLRSDSE